MTAASEAKPRARVPRQKAGGRPRGRPASDAASAVPEERVLGLALRRFAECGYEGTTLRDLARELGVSHNLLNVRFGSKAELWRRSVDDAVVRYGTPVFATFDAPGLDDERRLRTLVHRFCRWAAETTDVVGLTYVEARRRTWRLDYIVDAYLHPFKSQLDALLARVAAIRPVRALSTTAFMSMMVQGVGFYFASEPMLERLGVADELGAGKREEQIQLLAEFILGALLPSQ
ncbi:MAG: TetR/AcrR family transcriptional regulator [Alphaproteobacteria bacterium]|nr:TetR/AcrR family transcriptional regulator [Alphaproteobacteria bacterium]